LSIRESENVNFDGPKDCYERNARCGHFQIYSARTTPQAELKKRRWGDAESKDYLKRRPPTRWTAGVLY
jgi:hypothetical protein